MKKAYIILSLCLALATAAACSSEPGDADIEKSLLHHRFVLESVNSKPYSLQEPAPTISFDEGMRVSGIMCNNFTGQGKIEKGTLTVSQMASTRKLCFDELNQYETMIGNMLMNGSALEYDGQKLTLRQGENTLIYKTSDLIN